MPFHLLNEYNQKKLSTARLSLPVFVFLLGLLITALLVNAFHQSEFKFQQENLKSIAREFSKIQNLVLNNSILRIQSYSEISNLVHSDSLIQRRIAKEIIASTLFQRASILRLDKQSGEDGLPVLTLQRRIQTDLDPLPINKTLLIESVYIRKKIKKMLEQDLPNSIAITHTAQADIISLLWRSAGRKNEFIIFSATLEAFFRDSPQDPELTAVIYDTDTELALAVHQDVSMPFKFVEENSTPGQEPKNRTLLYNHYLISDNYGISIHWFQTTQDSFSLYVLMIAALGIFISLLTALFLRFILDQNRRIYTLVVSRTEQLEMAMNQAQEANLAKTRFLANMSHELRTPLNLILGMIELLQLTKQDQKSNEYLRNMQTAGEHLLNLITDLLSMSKEEVSDLKVNKSPFSVPVFFEEIAAIVGPECRKKNLGFEITISELIPSTLSGDPVKIRQILINLLRNSLKYTKRGYLSLHVELAPKESLVKGVCNIRFRVQDTGVGIPKSKMNLIFDRFFQLESSQMLTEGGVGLGLSIVKDLVSKMNGNIIVKSELGEGSTFTVDLDLECRDEQPWLSKFQLSKKTLVRIAIVTDSNSRFAHISSLLPEAIFYRERYSPNSIPDLLQVQAVFVACDVEGLIESLQAQYPDKKIIVIGNEKYIRGVTSLKNIFLQDDTPVLPSQLFELLDFKSLRRKADEALPPDESLSSTPIPNRRITALVVDDDGGNRQLMKAYLDSPDYEVVMAADGDEAFELYKQNRPDIIIADLRMPGLNGFELSAAISSFESRTHPGLPSPPFILLTADALESTSEEAKKYAISLFLTKPIRRTKILQAISKLTQPR